jgi:regulatory protein
MEMAGEISALVFQKRNQERVNVYLDGRYAFSLPAIEAAQLHRGQYLSNGQVEALREKGELQKWYDRVVRFLAYRPRSRAEVEKYLAEKGVIPAHAAEILERLTAAGLLDDLEFARFWVENRERFKPRGQRALQYELRQKGVSDTIIQEVLEEALPAEEESAYRAAQGRARRLSESEYVEFRRKLWAYLARRGFAYEAIKQAIERLWNDADKQRP